ncbi:MAG: signal peptide peptidase SppA [Cyclobacteriaceae bacterium]|nr:signal peptide peptidase SppA [Cyclobacteriaceae bacterium]
MNFFKAFFASCLGALVAMVALVGIIIIFLSALASDKEVVVKENSVLHLKLDAPIREMQGEDSFTGFPFGNVQPIGLMQLKQVIEHAKEDTSIKGIYLEVSMPMAGYSTVEEVRQALINFRSSGKWVIAYSEMYSEKAFYLATAADKILLHKEGDFEFNGLAVEGEFYKRLFDKLEIKPQVFRVGEFKSAVEPFLLDKMSDENRMQLISLINSIYDDVLSKISTARNIPQEQLRAISDKMVVKNGIDAEANGLVDSLVYFDEVLAELRSRVGVGENSNINFVKYNAYRKSFSTYKTSKNEIAVIVADGEIMPGKADLNNNLVGSDTFAEEIRKAREDKDIKAIVLRINSPGGSFQASDVMWREIDLASQTKPVIASMSDVAASGGYYLAMACDTIVAQSNTITGSIGIFGVMFDLSSFLGNKIGITFEEVKTGEYGERFTVTRPLTDAEKRIWQSELERHYETFTEKAAEGRSTTKDAIKKVGGGRVWTGTQALDNKLVDVLGGFDVAVQIAAEKAGVSSDYKIRFYPKRKPFLQDIMEQFGGEVEAKIMQRELGEHYVWFKKWEHLQHYQGAQARMPFDLKIN